MNDRPKLFEEFYESHLSLQYYHTRIHVLFVFQLDWTLKETLLFFKV